MFAEVNFQQTLQQTSAKLKQSPVGQLSFQKSLPPLSFRRRSPRKNFDLRGDASLAFETIEFRDMNVTHFLWNYFFTLDKGRKKLLRISTVPYYICELVVTSLQSC